MIKLFKINESDIFIECSFDEAREISNQFTFYAPGYMFNPKYKMGIWDGKIRLFSAQDCILPQGLLHLLIKYFRSVKIPFSVENKQLLLPGKKISDEKVIKFATKLLKCKYTPYDHQIYAVQQMIYQKKMIAIAATSSGKSYSAFLFFNLLKYLDDNFKFLLIVPTVQLVRQMSDDFCEYGENFCDYNNYIHQIYSGQEKHTDKPITISTWQSLQKIKDKKYFDQFNCVLVDEVHTANGKQLQNIVNACKNAEYKIGMTGTLKKAKADILQIISLFGQKVDVIRTKELIDKGFASPLKINAIILKYSKEISRVLSAASSYTEEVKFINEQSFKRNYICSLANNRKDNTLILFRTIKYGKLLKDTLKKISNKKIFYVDGKTKLSYRNNVRKYCETHSNCIVIASYGVFSTGISIKNLHNIIFGESMKAMYKIVQSIGRGLRLHKNKECALLFDIVDDLTYRKNKNYTLNHFFERIKYYEDDKFPYKIKKIEVTK